MERLRKLFGTINYSSFGKRGIVYMLGVLMMNFGIACYYQCRLGTDTYSVMVDGMHTLFRMSHGDITNILNALFFVSMLLFGRKYINVGTIVNFVVAGTLIDFFEKILSEAFPQKNIYGQIIMLIAGLITFAVGIGIYVVANLGMGGSEFVTLAVSEKTGINLRWVRIVFDVLCLLLGIVLGLIAGRKIFGDLVGAGTIMGAFGTGIIMKFTINIVEEPLNRWFGPLKHAVYDVTVYK